LNNVLCFMIVPPVIVVLYGLSRIGKIVTVHKV
jgi:hypothetical protein